MGLRKGMTNNPEGRPKGSQNKSTDEIRVTVKSFIENNMEGMQESFDQLEPKEKLMFMEKMLQYALPKMTVNNNVNVNFDNMSEPQLDSIIEGLTAKINDNESN